MIAKKRFIASAIKSAQQDVLAMPWARGTRRAAFIAKRNVRTTTQKAA